MYIYIYDISSLRVKKHKSYDSKLQVQELGLSPVLGSPGRI